MFKYLKNNFAYMLFSFFFVSMNAWLLEIFYSFIFRSRFILPGVLYGPWCPIYGITFIVLMLIINKDDKKIHNIFKIFIVSIIAEYLASFISDKIFHNIIWDYSNYLFNINGRVCMHMSILFTLLGYIMLYYIEPLLRRIYNKLDKECNIINVELLCLFIFDIFLKIISKM